jgi:hypothetical protein
LDLLIRHETIENPLGKKIDRVVMTIIGPAEWMWFAAAPWSLKKTMKIPYDHLREFS